MCQQAGSRIPIPAGESRAEHTRPSAHRHDAGAMRASPPPHWRAQHMCCLRKCGATTRGVTLVSVYPKVPKRMGGYVERET
jgi:hypothetical protein